MFFLGCPTHYYSKETCTRMQKTTTASAHANAKRSALPRQLANPETSTRPPSEILKLRGYTAWPEEPPGGKPRLRFSLSATVAGRPDRTAWQLIQRFGRPSQAGAGAGAGTDTAGEGAAGEVAAGEVTATEYNEFLERYVEATAAEAPMATFTLPFELFARRGGQGGLDPNCQGVFWVRPGPRAEFWLGRCRELRGRPVEVEVTVGGYRMPPEHPAAAARSGLLFDISWIKTLD